MGQLSIREANVKDAAHIALLGRITFTETFGHLFRYHHHHFLVDDAIHNWLRGIRDYIANPHGLQVQLLKNGTTS